MRYIDYIFKHWKTSLLALSVILGLGFWVTKVINTDDFIKVFAFAASIGFFAQKDPD
jgi:hypothetical protein